MDICYRKVMVLVYQLNIVLDHQHILLRMHGMQYDLIQCDYGETHVLNGFLVFAQKQMSELFDKNVKTINEHIKKVYYEKELDKSSTIRRNKIVQKEGKREIYFYNLDMVISVGYRVKSQRGILFRKWANRILKEYVLKGYTINKHKLKNSEL